MAWRLGIGHQLHFLWLWNVRRMILFSTIHPFIGFQYPFSDYCYVVSTLHCVHHIYYCVLRTHIWSLLATATQLVLCLPFLEATLVEVVLGRSGKLAGHTPTGFIDRWVFWPPASFVGTGRFRYSKIKLPNEVVCYGAALPRHPFSNLEMSINRLTGLLKIRFWTITLLALPYQIKHVRQLWIKLSPKQFTKRSDDGERLHW